MNHLTLKLEHKVKKVTISKTNSAADIAKMVESAFRLREKLIGLTDEYGKFYDLDFVSDNMPILAPHTLSLVLAIDANEQNMSFASQNMDYPKKQQHTYHTDIPPTIDKGYLGSISSLDIFEQLFLEEGKITVVLCSEYDQSQLKIPHRFFTMENDRNSVIVYDGLKKVGELFIEDWQCLPKKLEGFLKYVQKEDSQADEPIQSEEEGGRSEAIRSKESKFRSKQIKNPPEKLLNFKNQIPIIVRKYNNVIEKISTSYPLTVQQEHALNLMMELELKGLISENDARVFKSYILQEDPETFKVLMEYFEDLIDQIELSRKLKAIKQKVVNYLAQNKL